MTPAGCRTAAVVKIFAPPSVSAYCRQARRLRGRLSRQPARMHRELRALAPPVLDGGFGAVLRPVPVRSNARVFADQVATSLDGSVLRYGKRRALIADARQLRIGDFEANLIIAAVQHESRSREVQPPQRKLDAPANRCSWVAPLLLVVALELLLGAGFWQVCLR